MTVPKDSSRIGVQITATHPTDYWVELRRAGQNSIRLWDAPNVGDYKVISVPQAGDWEFRVDQLRADVQGIVCLQV